MKINAIDNNGKLKQYDAIMTYHSDEYKKDYVVYTDNIYNANNELQIYISEYNKENIETVVTEIIDNNEYNTIKAEINSILLIMKNESDKLDNID